jgi:hypothetical protein
MPAWLTALLAKIISIEVNKLWTMLAKWVSDLFTFKKIEKKDEVRVEKIEESSASDKPHPQKVQDANNFLNTIGKP